MAPKEIVAIHMVVLRTGRVLLFNADQNDPEYSMLDVGRSGEFDPTDDSISTAPSDSLRRNLFCAGQCVLPDGRVLVVGGQSSLAPGGADRTAPTISAALIRRRTRPTRSSTRPRRRAGSCRARSTSRAA